ncbi:hypothetical protein CT157_20575 [Pseudomonas syringae]|uniref:Polysaccharide pyruvyl transferase domain-containing protein n=1 Tax=Pseudomonas syringae TaxID=317 RepID=A0A3T0JXX1_PSESX|nr:hypothetical protein CT157_20575 [Pseudomonas syringae]
MKVALFNDTSSYHHVGCLAVSDAHDRMLSEAGATVEYRHFVNEFHNLWQGDEKSTRDFLANSTLAAEIASVDAVVINGEGTIHHGSGLHLLAILAYAQELGKRTILVNSVLQDVPVYLDVLRKLDDLTVREVNSFRYLASLGIDSRLVPDSIIGAQFNPGVDESYRGKIIITDCHLSREDVRQVLDKASEEFSADCVYFPLEYENSVNDWRDALKKFRAAKLIITGRHHAVYLALLAGTPFIALPSNTWKIEGTLEQLGGLAAMWKGEDIIDMAHHAMANAETYNSIFTHALLVNPLSTLVNLRDSGVPKSLLDIEGYKQLAMKYFSPLSDVLFLGSSASLNLFKNYSVARNFISGEIPFSALSNGAISTVTLKDAIPEMSRDVDSIVCIDAIVDAAGLSLLISLAEQKLRPGGRLLVRCSSEECVAGDIALDKESAIESKGLLFESSLNIGPLQNLQAEPDWILSFFKSPLVHYSAPYEERNLPEFKGKTHLIDFAEYYENPWNVHSLVEIPWRIKKPAQLFKLSKQVLSQSSDASADQGAALAILGWQYFESESAAELSSWSDAVDEYLKNESSDNPHVRRWCVSLNYLQARFCHRANAGQRALKYYKSVVDSEIFSITPTLGTKQVSAAYQAGMIHWSAGEHEQAVAMWKQGVRLAFECLSADMLEFVGNIDEPFLFSLNDSVEIIDGAVQCASALNIVSKRFVASESFILSALDEVSRNALRSAFNKVSQELQECSAEKVSLHARLNETLSAKQYAEDLAFARLDEIYNLCSENQRVQDQLKSTEDAKSYAESLAISRLAQLDALSDNRSRFDKINFLCSENNELRKQLELTENAKKNSDFLAISRLNELDALNVKSTEQAIQFGVELEELTDQLQATEKAKGYAESLALSRLNEIGALNVESMEQAKQFGVEIRKLTEQLQATEKAKEYAESLAISRLAELNALKESNEKRTELAELYADNQALRERLQLTEDAKAYAEELAISRLAELDAIKNSEGN